MTIRKADLQKWLLIIIVPTLQMYFTSCNTGLSGPCCPPIVWCTFWIILHSMISHLHTLGVRVYHKILYLLYTNMNYLL